MQGVRGKNTPCTKEVQDEGGRHGQNLIKHQRQFGLDAVQFDQVGGVGRDSFRVLAEDAGAVAAGAGGDRRPLRDVHDGFGANLIQGQFP